MMNRDEYVKKMHAKLDEINDEIDRLVARSGEIQEAGRLEFSAAMDDLRRHRDAAAATLQRLRESGDSAWQDLKAGLDLAWQAIEQAIESARARFK